MILTPEQRGVHRPPPDALKNPQGKLHADHEQQQQHAEFGQAVDLGPVLHQPQRRRPEQDAGENVADDGRLAQALEAEAAQQRRQHDDGDTDDVGMLDRFHGGSLSRQPY